MTMIVIRNDRELNRMTSCMTNYQLAPTMNAIWNLKRSPLINELYEVNHAKMVLKGSIFLKNRHFLSKKGLIKLIYSINTIIKCGI